MPEDAQPSNIQIAPVVDARDARVDESLKHATFETPREAPEVQRHGPWLETSPDLFLERGQVLDGEQAIRIDAQRLHPIDRLRREREPRGKAPCVDADAAHDKANRARD